jgi:hypothetical protein
MTSDIRDTHTLSPDGKKLIEKKKRYDVCKELQMKKKPKVKVRPVQDFRV